MNGKKSIDTGQSEKEKQKRIKKARSRNRAVNYYVFYLMWHAICPARSFKLYDTWGIDYQRMVGAMEEKEIKTSEFCENIPKITKLSPGLFSGEIRINTPNVSRELWDEYLNALELPDFDEEKEQRLDAARKEIKERLKPLDFSDPSALLEDDFYYLCYYFKFTALEKKPEINCGIDDLSTILSNKITLQNLLKNNDLEYIAELSDVLEEKKKLIDAFLVIGRENTKNNK